MDRVIELDSILNQEVKEWADGVWLETRAYAVVDSARHIYTVMAVPDYPRRTPAGIVVMARVVADKVVIEHDISDQPLWEMLVRRGIPRDQIILTYIGEPAPDMETVE